MKWLSKMASFCLVNLILTSFAFSAPPFYGVTVDSNSHTQIVPRIYLTDTGNLYYGIQPLLSHTEYGFWGRNINGEIITLPRFYFPNQVIFALNTDGEIISLVIEPEIGYLKFTRNNEFISCSPVSLDQFLTTNSVGEIISRNIP